MAGSGNAHLRGGESVLRVENLVMEFPARRGRKVQAVSDVSFDLRRGEILGLAGLVGAGRTELARTIFGADRRESGEILVAVTTNVGWTPLFPRAAAVVTDVGGPLSHGSIVAREYGIPAVMGTGIATKRIRNGQMITVDGGAGTVTLQ